jgi:hypothetical protein
MACTRSGRGAIPASEMLWPRNPYCGPYLLLGGEAEPVRLEKGQHCVEVLHVVGHGLAGHQDVIQVVEHVQNASKDLVHHAMKRDSGQTDQTAFE